MIKKLKEYIRLFRKDFKFLFLEMLPKNKVEKSILIASLCLYLPIALFLNIKTDLIWKLDYFDFDNPGYINILTSFKGWMVGFRHPFVGFILIPFKIIGYVFFLLTGAKDHFYFVSLIFPVFVSFTNIFVFRYLKDITKISTKRALLLISFFAFFATNLTLSFTPESFPFSLFFLSFMIMFFSGLILTKKKIPFSQLFILSFLTGGITSTNIVKCFILDFFSNTKFKRWIKRSFLITLIFVTLCTCLLMMGGKVSKSITFIEYYTTTEAAYYPEYVIPVGNALFSYFWNAPITWGDFAESSLLKVERHVMTGKLNIAPYSHPFHSVFGGVLLLLCVISGCLNRKNKLVCILILCFAVDLFITGVLKYGLCNSFVFGGHWVFIIPMLFGWMYPGLKNKRQRTIFDIVMIGMFAALLINNAYRMSQIFDFALKYYPA